MRIKLNINGTEIDAEISKEDAERIVESSKDSGFSRVEPSDYYYFDGTTGNIEVTEYHPMNHFDKMRYDCGNFYSDKVVAENNIRADNLFRRIRQYAAQHNLIAPYFDSIPASKYCYIYYDPDREEDCLDVVFNGDSSVNYGVLLFKNEECARAIINKFRKELLWYFEEYHIYKDTGAPVYEND